MADKSERGRMKGRHTGLPLRSRLAIFVDEEVLCLTDVIPGCGLSRCSMASFMQRNVAFRRVKGRVVKSPWPQGVRQGAKKSSPRRRVPRGARLFQSVRLASVRLFCFFTSLQPSCRLRCRHPWPACRACRPPCPGLRIRRRLCKPSLCRLR